MDERPERVLLFVTPSHPVARDFHEPMALVRSIGKWALAGLMVNAMIGSGIFGVPGELIGLVGAASPGAFLVAGLAMAIIVACFVEVASQFTSAGGPYLYVRTAFGRLPGLQVAWFYALTPMAAAAAHANLFVSYLAGFQSALGEGVARSLVMCVLIGVPAFANLLGATAGKSVSSILVVAKLLPLALLIGVGLSHSSAPAPSYAAASIGHGPAAWFTAVLLAVVCFGGFEDTLAAAGEVKEPPRTMKFALAISLAGCVLVYTLVQLVVVRALGESTSSHPLADSAAALVGSRGATLVAIAAMVSTAGAISAIIVGAPRIVFALARNGDLPAFLADVQGPGSSPVPAILVVSAVILVLAVSGTYRLALAVTAGSTVIMFGSVCAALIRLRTCHPAASAVRIPLGMPVAALGVVLSLLLVTQLAPREAALMGIVVLIAGVHWLCIRGRPEEVLST